MTCVRCVMKILATLEGITVGEGNLQGRLRESRKWRYEWNDNSGKFLDEMDRSQYDLLTEEQKQLWYDLFLDTIDIPVKAVSLWRYTLTVITDDRGLFELYGKGQSSQSHCDSVSKVSSVSKKSVLEWMGKREFTPLQEIVDLVARRSCFGIKLIQSKSDTNYSPILQIQYYSSNSKPDTVDASITPDRETKSRSLKQNLNGLLKYVNNLLSR